MSSPLLEVQDLVVGYPHREGSLGRLRPGPAVVDGLSFTLEPGESLAVVGESGCGKTTLARALVRLIEPRAGSVRFRGTELLRLGPQQLRPMRRHLQLIFQDSYGSLDPRMTVTQLVGEGLEIEGRLTPAERDTRVVETLLAVELSPDFFGRYPHQLSGGQRQRVALARTLVLDPELIIADEPFSALDLRLQAQMRGLLKRLGDERTLSFLFITHDLRLAEQIAPRLAVMYRGRWMETGPCAEVLAHPRHPYTQKLVGSMLRPDPRWRRPALPKTREPAAPSTVGTGCPYQLRCPHAFDRCLRDVPPLREVGLGHRSACFLDVPGEE